MDFFVATGTANESGILQFGENLQCHSYQFWKCGKIILQINPGTTGHVGIFQNNGIVGDGSGGLGFGFNNPAGGAGTNTINITNGLINNGDVSVISGIGFGAVMGQGSTVNVSDINGSTVVTIDNENSGKWAVSTLGGFAGKLGTTGGILNFNCTSNGNLNGNQPANRMFNLLNGVGNAGIVGSNLSTFNFTAGLIRNLRDTQTPAHLSTFIFSDFNLLTGSVTNADMTYSSDAVTVIVNSMTATQAITTRSAIIDTVSNVNPSTVVYPNTSSPGYSALFQCVNGTTPVNLQLFGHEYTNKFDVGGVVNYSGSCSAPTIPGSL